MGQDDASPRKGLLGRLLDMAASPKPQPEPAPQPVVQKPGTGPVRSGTDVFKPSAAAAAAPRPKPVAPVTQQLVVPQAPKPQMGTGNVFPGDGLPADEASEERLAFLDAFFDDPTASRLFQDAKYMYKVVSDERNHQVAAVLLVCPWLAGPLAALGVMGLAQGSVGMLEAWWQGLEPAQQRALHQLAHAAGVSLGWRLGSLAPP